MATRAVTGNAADQEQVRYAERHNRRAEERVRGAMREALQSPAARFVLMELLYAAKCDVAFVGEEHPELEASTYDPGAKIHYNQGRRDLGLLVIGWIEKADSGALDLMRTEKRRREEATNREVDAVHATAHAAREGTNG